MKYTFDDNNMILISFISEKGTVLSAKCVWIQIVKKSSPELQ